MEERTIKNLTTPGNFCVKFLHIKIWSAKEKKGTPGRISSLYLFVAFVQLKLCSKWIKSVYNVLYKRIESDLNMIWKGQYHQEF